MWSIDLRNRRMTSDKYEAVLWEHEQTGSFDILTVRPRTDVMYRSDNLGGLVLPIAKAAQAELANFLRMPTER